MRIVTAILLLCSNCFAQLPIVPLQTTVVANQVTFATQLTGYWPLNEASGTTRIDATGNGLSLAQGVNTVDQNFGVITNSAYFHLGGAGLQSSSSQFQVGAGGRTFTCWALTTSLSFGQIILSKWDDSGGAGNNDEYILLGFPTLQFIVRKGDNSGNVTVTSTITPAASTWYFVACGYDSSLGQIWLSVNNEPRVTASIASARSSNVQFRLGSSVNYNTLGTLGLDGLIDELGMWNRSLSQTELTNLMATMSYTAIARGDTTPGADNASRWAGNIQVNGGALPSSTSSNAIASFVNATTPSGVYSQLVSCNLVAPDSLTAALTSLRGPSWVNHNFIGGDLTINGLTGNGVDKYIDSGVNSLTGIANPDNCGISIYGYATTSGPYRDCGTYVLATDSTFGLQLSASDIGSGSANGGFGQGASSVTVHPSPGNGFYSANRVSNTDNRMYFANSGSAFAQVGSVNTTARSQTYLNGTVSFFASNIPGISASYEPCPNTLSYTSIHQGFNSAQAQVEYNAAQAARVAIGGGSR